MASDLHIRLIDPTQQRAGSYFGYGNPMLVTGLQKTANLWLKTFLTPKNSHPWRQAEGTDFPYLLGSNIGEIDVVQTSIIEYIDDATTQVKAMQTRRRVMDAEERLAQANLQRFVRVGADGVEFWVELVNAASRSLPVLIPYLKV